MHAHADLFNLWFETVYFGCRSILYMLSGDHLVIVETDHGSLILFGMAVHILFSII